MTLLVLKAINKLIFSCRKPDFIPKKSISTRETFNLNKNDKILNFQKKNIKHF